MGTALPCPALAPSWAPPLLLLPGGSALLLKPLSCGRPFCSRLCVWCVHVCAGVLCGVCGHVCSCGVCDVRTQLCECHVCGCGCDVRAHRCVHVLRVGCDVCADAFTCVCMSVFVCSCGVWGVVQHVCVRMMCWCVCVCAGVFMWHVCVCARVCVPAPELEPSPLLTRAGPTGDTEAAAAQPCTQFGPPALRPQSADSRGQVVLWLVGVSPQSPGVAAAPPHTCFLPLNSVLFLP